MTKNQKIKVEGMDIAVFKQKSEDYISLTDIAKHKNSKVNTL